MSTSINLKEPWLIAAWPAMGHVALSAGYYLLAKLGMHQLSELSATELFDIEHVEVKFGRVQTPVVWHHICVVISGTAPMSDVSSETCLSLIGMGFPTLAR